MKEIAYNGVLFRLYTSTNASDGYGGPAMVIVDAKRLDQPSEFLEVGHINLEDRQRDA